MCCIILEKDYEVRSSIVTKSLLTLSKCRERGPLLKNYIGSCKGEKFDNGSSKRITVMTVRSGRIVDSIVVYYDNGSFKTYSREIGYEY